MRVSDTVFDNGIDKLSEGRWLIRCQIQVSHEGLLFVVLKVSLVFEFVSISRHQSIKRMPHDQKLDRPLLLDKRLERP